MNKSEINRAFKLNPVKIHNSTGLPMNDIIRYTKGYEVDQMAKITMDSFYSEISDEIDKICRKLNLVQGENKSENSL